MSRAGPVRFRVLLGWDYDPVLDPQWWADVFTLASSVGFMLGTLIGWVLS